MKRDAHGREGRKEGSLRLKLVGGMLLAPHLGLCPRFCVEWGWDGTQFLNCKSDLMWVGWRNCPKYPKAPARKSKHHAGSKQLEQAAKSSCTCTTCKSSSGAHRKVGERSTPPTPTQNAARRSTSFPSPFCHTLGTPWETVASLTFYRGPIQWVKKAD